MPDLDPGSYKWTDYQAALSGVVKVGPGMFDELDFTNTSAGTLYLQLFDSPTVPGDAVAPNLFFSIPIAAGGIASFRAPRPFVTGLCWCASSTSGTKTITTGTPFAGSICIH